MSARKILLWALAIVVIFAFAGGIISFIVGAVKWGLIILGAAFLAFLVLGWGQKDKTSS